MITMKNVRKSYDNGADALRGINLEVADGEFVFIVGPSGSGKSTLTKILTGEISCTDGEVMVNGFDLDRMRPSKLYKLRRTLGIIFQDFRLIENKTVYQNIEFAMRVLGVKPKKIKPRIKYVLELVGLQDKINCMPNELSGGEQQRVAIARALANNPRLIIADEPTTALDVTIQAQILELLKDLQKKQGCSIMLITHDLGVIAEMADEVVVMYAGRVIEKGTAHDIFHTPLHPYTIGLQKSKPMINSDVNEPLYSIPGQVPNPINLPNSCYFKSRCSKCVEKCEGEYPAGVQVSDTHWVSCYLYEEKADT